MKSCDTVGCQLVSRASGMCMKHYNAYRNQIRMQSAWDKKVDKDDFWEFVKQELGITS